MPEHPAQQPVALFYSYANADEALRETLEKHLSLLQRQGFLSSWHDRQILAGDERAREIDEHLTTAAIILLLISPDFLASDYCYEIEMRQAMERHQRGEARVIPIILRPCSWQCAPFGALQALPRDRRAITTWENQDEAFLEVEQSLRTLIEHQPNVSHSSKTYSIATRYRENMLRRLQQMYEELLADSLQEVAWIELGLFTQPGAVQNAANLLLRRAMQTAHSFPPHTSIRQVYQEANQELLILGEPGAGKSTLLYQLGRDLLREAIQQPMHPLPILFPLSFWAEKRLPLQEWMGEQLASPLYEVSRKLSQQLIQRKQILPLLDGLDEMEEAARPACIVAINTYRREHPLCPLVVCSRSNEYMAASMQQRLHLQCAVEIQPLSPAHLDATLIQVGKPFAALRAELKKNTDLRELASNPLWLNVLLLTFKNTPVQALPQRRSDLHQHLFQRYVQRMVEQKGDQNRYPLDATVRWLSWLAKQMHQHNQTIFSIELLQLDWLSNQQRLKYRWSIRLLFGAPAGALVGALIGVLLGQKGGTLSELLFGVLIGVEFGAIGGLLFGSVAQKKLAARPPFSWQTIRTGVVAGVIGGLLYGVLLGVIGGLFYGILFGAIGGLLYFFLAGLFFGLRQSQPFERPNLSPEDGIRYSFRNGLLAALLTGLSGALMGNLFLGVLGGVVGMLFGVLSGMFFGLLAVVQHMFLRFSLGKTGSFPFQAGAFLEDARARHLLQRVGGTYRFVHRLLLDYFADLGGDASETTEAAGAPVPAVTSDDA